MTLADVDDYTDRYGAPADVDRCQVLLDSASSLVVHAAGEQILVPVDDSEVLLVGDGSRYLFLPQIPVRAIDSITVDGVVVDPSAYRWNDAGLITRRFGTWSCERDALVVYDHGFAPVPPWLVTLVCAMVQRAGRPAALTGLQSMTTGSQTIAYSTSAAGVSLWLTTAESEDVEALRNPVLG